MDEARHHHSDGQWKDASEYGRALEDPNIGWVKVPDTNIANTGGKKRWGALAGKCVRAEIWRDLNEINIANNPGTWRTLMTQFKKNKTGRNPVVHMNNIMSNVVLMDLADVRMQDLHAGVKAFFKGDASTIRRHSTMALSATTWSAKRFAIRCSSRSSMRSASRSRARAIRSSPKLVSPASLPTSCGRGPRPPTTACCAPIRPKDQLFRMATYMRRRSQGESPQVAALNARDQFLNYDIRALWIVMMRNTLFPFISYTYRAVPKLAESIVAPAVEAARVCGDCLRGQRAVLHAR